jgi:hypothetical protein
MKLSDELKNAVKALPEKEKDKYLIRLLPKNKMLVYQLEFQLLENGATTVERRNEVAEQIEKELKIYPNNFRSIKYLLAHMRSLSGQITQHVTITKDKTGEIELNLLLVDLILSKNIGRIANIDAYYIEKFYNYVAKRIVKLLSLIDKIHEDYLIDFQSRVQSIGKFVADLPSLERELKMLKVSTRQLVDFPEL